MAKTLQLSASERRDVLGVAATASGHPVALIATIAMMAARALDAPTQGLLFDRRFGPLLVAGCSGRNCLWWFLSLGRRT